jgi:acyl carrier protein
MNHQGLFSPPGGSAVRSDVAADALRLEIAAWLTRYVADLLGLTAESIDEHTSFDRFGLDSTAAIAMSGDLGEWLQCEVDAAAAYDYPSIAELAEALTGDETVRASLLRRTAPRGAGEM